MDANKIREIRIIRENPRFRRYSEYKESGVEWIEEIPNHWRYSRLKFHLTGNSGGIWGEDDEFGNGTYVLRSTEITIDGHWDLQNLIKRKLSKEEAERFLLKKGDLIITKSSGSQNHIGKTGLVDEKIEAMVVCYSNFVQRLRPKNHINSKFLHYFMNCSLAREQYKYQSETTTGLANLSTKSIDELLISLPPIQEQTQIANFLDRKTKQIDELIRIKERRIELLQAQRTALINQVVTKGLDPNVEMKPSGVEWIGEIPRHWNLSMLKYTARLVYGDTLISENRQNGVLPVYGSNGIIDTHSSANTLSPAIIVGRKGSLGKIQYSDVPCFVIDTAYFIDRRTSHVNLRWLYYVLHALKLERFRNSVLPGLNRKDTEGQYVPLITAEEQDQIANFLDQKTQQTNELISEEQRKIELLKEYRQSLISEAVTGKIDVRNEV